jgi:hypothetical protein
MNLLSEMKDQFLTDQPTEGLFVCIQTFPETHNGQVKMSD